MQKKSVTVSSNSQPALDKKVILGLLEALPAALLNQHRCLPLRQRDGVLICATDKPVKSDVQSELEFLCGKNLQITLMDKLNFDQLLASLSLKSPTSQNHSVQQFTQHATCNEDIQLHSDRNVIPLVNEIISTAIYSRASDIHVESFDTAFRIRYRIDGVLQEAKTLPLDLRAAVVSRLKIMADLDIAEKRRPQDGRIRVNNQERTVDIRVSTLPTDFGEKIVLRILDKSAADFNLRTIGLSPQELDLLLKTIHLPYGIVLVTGPTGSGKSTTLYSILKELNSAERNILTIEDPIEYNLEGINQSHVRADIGYNFAAALRAFLRQDPDVIMVGEIRDRDTADIAVRAALTGHLLLSTLHTNDAPTTITRLVDMGIEPFLISSAARLVIAQRLVRVLCPLCKGPSVHQMANIPYRNLKSENIMESRGCEACRFTGYKGRTALFEIMPVNDAMIELVNKRSTADKIREQALHDGMRTLREKGLSLVQQGLTSLNEVIKETGID